MSQLTKKFGPLPRYVKSYFAIRLTKNNLIEVVDHFGGSYEDDALSSEFDQSKPAFMYTSINEPTVYAKLGDYIVYEDGRLKKYSPEEFNIIFTEKKD